LLPDYERARGWLNTNQSGLDGSFLGALGDDAIAKSGAQAT
jgi:hypothetical protein